MADIFSSHPYKRPGDVKPEFHFCEDCEKLMKYKDKNVHERGKKHAAKVREKNPLPETPIEPPALTGNECHNCGQPGHRKSECTNERKYTGTCNNCGKGMRSDFAQDMTILTQKSWSHEERLPRKASRGMLQLRRG